MPLALLSAVWLWRRVPWGYMLAGCMLIKAATMGLALLGSYLIIAVGGLGISVWFFRHCRG